MLPSKIKSRPQYEELSPAPAARRHLVAAEGEGAEAVLGLFAKAGADFAAKAHILYTSVGPGTDPHVERLHALNADRCDVLPSIEALLGALDDLLAHATMGTRLYATGTEGFIGRVLQVAMQHAIDPHSVPREHRGSLARRVQCVHCKGFTENVTTSLVECSQCGNLLFVRDHYSRRLAAFQGVCVNAEDPSVRPAPETAYP
jgi:hypothetical protein